MNKEQKLRKEEEEKNGALTFRHSCF